MTYSQDFRKHVLDYKDKYGLTFQQTEDHFEISIRSLFRWERNIAPCATRNKAPTKLNNAALLEDVEKYPDAYQSERAERFGVCQSAIHYGLKRINITCKKNASASKSR